VSLDQTLAISPPSMRTGDPVMQDARALARKTMASAYYCGVRPHRLTGRGE
jgi:hypothetical protein